METFQHPAAGIYLQCARCQRIRREYLCTDLLAGRAWIPVRCTACGLRFSARSIAGFCAAVEAHCRSGEPQPIVWTMEGI